MNGTTLFLLRGRTVCLRYGPQIAVALAVVSLVALAGAGWAYARPPTEQITEQTHGQSVAVATNESALVTGESALWETGTRLVEKPFYPLPAASNLTLRIRTSVPDGSRVNVSQRLSAVYRTSEDGTTLWEERHPLAEQNATVSDGEAAMTTTVDVRELRHQRSRYNAELTGIGRASVSLALRVRYDTGRYAGVLSASAPVSIGQNRYAIGGSLDASETHTTPVTRTVPRRDRSQFPLLLGISFLCAGGAAVSWRVYRNEDADLDELEEAIRRARFEEWISEGHITRSIDEEDVPIHSITDLVDVAIDSGRRVVYDPDRELYAVIDDGPTFYHYPGNADEGADPPVPDDSGTDDERGSVRVDPDVERDPWSDLLEEAAEPEFESEGESGANSRPGPQTPNSPGHGSSRSERVLPDGSRDAWEDLMGEPLRDTVDRDGRDDPGGTNQATGQASDDGEEREPDDGETQRAERTDGGRERDEGAKDRETDEEGWRFLGDRGDGS